MMNITLLAAQAALADTLAGGNPTLTPVSGEAQMNLWDMAVKGGWIMLVLALLSVACFYIFFERLAYIRKAGKEDPLFMERIRDYIRTGEVKSAINYCRITNTPSARMIEKGISRMGRPVADVQAAIENAGNIEGMGPARARAQAGRCGEHPARNEALARGGVGQLVLARGHRRAGRRRVERVAGARCG